jgi:Putative prokaryotic signal transducing protein
MDDPQDLVSVYLGANVTEAHFVKNLLADAGIDARVSEENEPLAGLPVVPPDVLVRRQDQAQAEAVVAQYEEQQIARADTPDWKCANCGEMVPGTFDECDNCGTDRPA